MTTTEPITSEYSTDVRRKANEWTSPKGMDMSSVPMRLWEKSKAGFWDPKDVDFSKDREQWKSFTTEQKHAIFGLAQGFMIGEEGVTLDILPLMMAMSDQGRLEEVMYLTMFAMEEAKHIDFFRRWFDACEIDIAAMNAEARERVLAAGGEPVDPNRDEGLFESILPRVMRQAMVEGTEQAILEASITYNQYIEGCLALSGYVQYAEFFDKLDALPGLQEGIRLIRKDEGRHITYGTFLCQRILSANPELIDFATAKLRSLNEDYANRSNRVSNDDNENVFSRTFEELVEAQIEKRCAIMTRAAQMAEGDVIDAEAEEEKAYEAAYGTAAGG